MVKSKTPETLHMETTTIAPEKTIAEIQKELRKYGLRRFNTVYTMTGEVEAVYFSILIENAELPYRLPVRYKALLELARRGETKYIKPGDVDHAKRVAWRIAYRWVQAQLAFVKTEMVTIPEIFLPYLVDDKNQTLFEKFSDTNFAGYLLKDKNS